MKHLKWKAGLVTGVVCVGLAGLALSGCASSPKAETEPANAAPATHTATLHRGYAAAHGENAFAQVVVATAEDGSILGVNVDEYQFTPKASGAVGVPNSDAKFGAQIINDSVLMSKTDNNEMYSKMMKDKAQATQPWLTSMQAIESFAKGKMPADLTKASGPDAVSGATLVDTANYLKAIATVAKSSDVTSEGTYTGDGADLKIGRTLAKAHGESAICSAVTLVQGDTIVATNIDEFQFMASTTAGIVPVPNSDKGLAKSIVEGSVLASKALNNASYSEMLKTKGNATQPWLTSMQAIESYVAGKTPADAGKAKGPDAVSGATLVDTAGYIQAATAAAATAA